MGFSATGIKALTCGSPVWTRTKNLPVMRRAVPVCPGTPVDLVYPCFPCSPGVRVRYTRISFAVRSFLVNSRKVPRQGDTITWNARVRRERLIWSVHGVGEGAGETDLLGAQADSGPPGA